MAWLHIDLDKRDTRTIGAITDDDGEVIAKVSGIEMNADTIQVIVGFHMLTRGTGSGNAKITLDIPDLSTFQRALRGDLTE